MENELYPVVSYHYQDRLQGENSNKNEAGWKCRGRGAEASVPLTLPVTAAGQVLLTWRGQHSDLRDGPPASIILMILSGTFYIIDRQFPAEIISRHWLFFCN